jgi:hypothetical protein
MCAAPDVTSSGSNSESNADDDIGRISAFQRHLAPHLLEDDYITKVCSTLISEDNTPSKPKAIALVDVESLLDLFPPTCPDCNHPIKRDVSVSISTKKN